MKQAFTLVILAFLGFQAKGQTLAKSIYVEYGYTNIKKEYAQLYTLFGRSRYSVYADDKFLMVESYLALPVEKEQQGSQSLRTLFILEKAKDSISLCLSFDTLFIRMPGGDEERASLHKMLEAFSSDQSPVYGSGSKKASIQGYDCSEILVRGKFTDTISAFVSERILLDPVIKDFPVYISSAGRPMGLMLGRNEVLKGNLLEFRAIQLEINQPRDIRRELARYQLVSKEEGEKRMKLALSHVMRMPAGDGKN